MVAKVSKYVGLTHNGFAEVRAFAHSHAVAAFSARAFNEVASEINVRVRVVFVPCFLYEDTASGECMIGERYLLGVFLKYNSNNGYVNDFAPHAGASVLTFFVRFVRGLHAGVGLAGSALIDNQTERERTLAPIRSTSGFPAEEIRVGRSW